MYPEIPIGLALAFVAGGLYVLAWSADRFVEGAEVVARALGVSPFIIGMVIVGFGTSAPELAVSALSGVAGRSATPTARTSSTSPPSSESPC